MNEEPKQEPTPQPVAAPIERGSFGRPRRSKYRFEKGQPTFTRGEPSRESNRYAQRRENDERARAGKAR